MEGTRNMEDEVQALIDKINMLIIRADNEVGRARMRDNHSLTRLWKRRRDKFVDIRIVLEQLLISWELDYQED